jgi:hypothetical protein
MTPACSLPLPTPHMGHTVGTVLVGGKGGIPQNAHTSNGWGMIVPRFGLSYREDNKTVVRTGFGMTIDPDTLRNLLQSYPAAVTTSISGASGYVPATSLNAGLLSPTTQVGIPALTDPDIITGYLPSDTTLTTNMIQKNYRRGYINSYNLSVFRRRPRQTKPAQRGRAAREPHRRLILLDVWQLHEIRLIPTSARNGDRQFSQQQI